MAYAAAISLKTILMECYPNPAIEYLKQMVDSIQTFDFQENDREGKKIEKEIRDALWRAEDIIESYILTRFLSQEDANERSGDMSLVSSFFKDLIEQIQEIKAIKERMDHLKHGKESSIIPVAMSVISSTDDLPPVHKNKMVGHQGQVEGIKVVLMGRHDRWPYLRVFGIYGMGGIGKTSLAISIYNDPDVRGHFSVGAWVQISLQHSVRNILLNLFHTIEFFDDGRMMRNMENFMEFEEKDDEELANFLRAFFLCQRYLVIVDCLCDINLSSWNYIRTILLEFFTGSRIILVSRMKLDSGDSLANALNEVILPYCRKSFLNEAQSWNLLRQQVFGDEPCLSIVLEKIGKKIANKCGGLPLAIVTVGTHLAKKEKTVEYWNKVADSGNSIAYAEDGEPMFEQLGLTYNQMPLCLKPIFLYMGVFRESERISFEEVRNLCVAEILLDLEKFGTPGNMCSELCNYFLQRDLLMDSRMHNPEMMLSLHHAMWHFCCNQAKEEELFHVFDDYIKNDGEDSNVDSKIRRLVIRKALHFGIVELARNIEHSALSIRSMLFTGAYHSYPLTRILWGHYKMLRVLNACSIRFYEFPTEILHLKLLRYVALTLNGGDLPSGISKLKILETLVVHFHHIVRSYGGNSSYLPMEIWEMRQLIHLEVMGFDLPAPPHPDSLLPNLETLLGVSPLSCTKKVLERIPNIRTLQMSINLAPKKQKAPMCLFDRRVPLENLRRASFVINNPYFEDNSGLQVVAIPDDFLFSMKNLRDLYLCGCGFSWDSIEPIAQLPILLRLELRSHAFRGPKWELKSAGFSQLEVLHLEDLDLVYWTTTSGDHFFPCLNIVTIINCHKLEQIPDSFVDCPSLFDMRIVESSRAAETWADSTSMRRIIIASHRRGFSIKLKNIGAR